MIQLIIIGGIVVFIITAIIGLYCLGRSAGKEEEIHKKTAQENEILTAASKIRASTVNDSIDTSRKRLRKRLKDR